MEGQHEAGLGSPLETAVVGAQELLTAYLQGAPPADE